MIDLTVQTPINKPAPEVYDFVVTHYVGTQKLFKRQIDLYRQSNPNFLMLTYHLAYGLNGAENQNEFNSNPQPTYFTLRLNLKY